MKQNDFHIVFNVISKNTHFTLSTVGVSFPDNSYHTKEQQRFTTSFEYIISGKGTVICNGKKIQVQAGDCFILPRGCTFEYYADKDDPWTKVWINCFGGLFPGMLFHYQLNETVCFHKTPCYHIFKEILKVCRDNSATFEEIEASVSLLLHRLIIFLYNHTPGDSNKKVTQNEKDAHAIKAYLDSHFCEKIKISDLASLIFKSESQAIRIFKSVYDIAPRQYILKLRMITAQQLLHQTTIPVKELAFMLGYSDEHYFSYLFHKKTGLTPSEYRQNQIAE